MAREADPILAGHHHVEHDQVKIEPCQNTPRMCGITCGADKETIPDQELLQQATNTFVIVDNKKVRVWISHFSARPAKQGIGGACCHPSWLPIQF